MNITKLTPIIKHPQTLPSVIFFCIGLLTGYLLSGRVDTVLLNFQYLLYNRWWALLGLFLLGIVGWVHFRVEQEKMAENLILQLDTLNALKKRAAADVSEEWKQVRSQYVSIEEMRMSIQSGQQQLSSQWKQLSRERIAYLRFAEETAIKIEKKSKVLVGGIEAKDPSKSARFRAENQRLVKHLRSAPLKLKSQRSVRS